MFLQNNGTIIANGANALNLTPNSGGFNNGGTVTVNSGSSLVLDTTASTNVRFLGLVNSGTIGVSDGATLEFEDSSTSGNAVGLVNNGAIDVGGSGAGWNARVRWFGRYLPPGSGYRRHADAFR